MNWPERCLFIIIMLTEFVRVLLRLRWFPIFTPNTCLNTYSECTTNSFEQLKTFRIPNPLFRRVHPASDSKPCSSGASFFDWGTRVTSCGTYTTGRLGKRYLLDFGRFPAIRLPPFSFLKRRQTKLSEAAVREENVSRRLAHYVNEKGRAKVIAGEMEMPFSRMKLKLETSGN